MSNEIVELKKSIASAGKYVFSFVDSLYELKTLQPYMSGIDPNSLHLTVKIINPTTYSFAIENSYQLNSNPTYILWDTKTGKSVIRLGDKGRALSTVKTTELGKAIRAVESLFSFYDVKMLSCSLQRSEMGYALVADTSKGRVSQSSY